jgi:crotonobetainyl-CoA:carnitine CoA-transferase CaiB-like acyl-CoA transferase
MSPAPFAGLRILELARVVAAPTATQMLADFGAEVIKVEQPGAGDMIRSYGPVWARGPDGEKGDGAMHFAVNRNKKSITLDLSKPKGQAIARDLAKQADVLVENYKAGTLKRFGLDYESLRLLNPRLVYCSLTGYGQDGPYAPRPGFDAVFQAQGGMMSVTGMPDGMPGAGPTKVGLNIIDSITGYNAAFGIVTALYERMRSGEGQHLDIALLDCAVAANGPHATQHLLDPTYIPARRHTWSLTGGPQEVMECSDGPILLIGGSDAMFAALCRVLDLPGLPADPRFRTAVLRAQNRAVLADLLQQRIAGRTRADLLAALAAADVPAGAVNDMKAVFADPQVRHRNTVVTLPHPLAGSVDTVANPVRLSRTPAEYHSAPPLLGAHTEEVLQGLLGLDAQAVQALRDEGIV